MEKIRTGKNVSKTLKLRVMKYDLTFISEDMFTGKAKLNITSLEIPEGIKEIRDSAFRCCERLKTVTIPNSVTHIGNWAFWRCDRLTGIVISDGVTDIGHWAFCECRSLTRMTIPVTVTSIGYNAFACSGLTRVTFNGKTLEEVRSMKNYPWGIEDESIIETEF